LDRFASEKKKSAKVQKIRFIVIMSELIKPIPEGMESQWECTLNGAPVDVREFRASHPNLGTLAFGERFEKTIGWIWSEVGRGGDRDGAGRV
jgi:hypothetical protein